MTLPPGHLTMLLSVVCYPYYTELNVAVAPTLEAACFVLTIRTGSGVGKGYSLHIAGSGPGVDRH